MSITNSNGDTVAFLSETVGGGSRLDMYHAGAANPFIQLFTLNNCGVLQMYDDQNNYVIGIDGETGEIKCSKIWVQNVSAAYTVTGASGTMEIDTNNWEVRRTGSVVFMAINFKGKGQNVGAGSNAFVGTLNGPLPAIPAKLVAYYSGDVFILNIATDGAMTLRNCGAARTFTTSQAITICGSFVTEN